MSRLFLDFRINLFENIFILEQKLNKFGVNSQRD